MGIGEQVPPDDVVAAFRELCETDQCAALVAYQQLAERYGWPMADAVLMPVLEASVLASAEAALAASRGTPQSRAVLAAARDTVLGLANHPRRPVPS